MSKYVEEHIHLSTTGIRMEILSIGKGTLMVCLHGFPEMARSWRRQMDYFGSRGYLVAAPNMRGYGATERPRKGYDLDTLADDISGVIRHYKRKSAIIVGHDWGGVVAWHLAYRAPERVDALIIMNAPHPVRFEEVLRTSRRQRIRSLYMMAFQAPELPEIFLGLNGAKPVAEVIRRSAVRKGAFTDDDLREYSRHMSRKGALRAGIEYYREARRGAFRLRKFYRGKKITSPTLVIWAQQDRFLGPELAEGLEPFMDAPLEVVPIENCGHWVQQEAADEVNEVMEKFLNKYNGQAA